VLHGEDVLCGSHARTAVEDDVASVLILDEGGVVRAQLIRTSESPGLVNGHCTIGEPRTLDVTLHGIEVLAPAVIALGTSRVEDSRRSLLAHHVDLVDVNGHVCP